MTTNRLARHAGACLLPVLSFLLLPVLLMTCGDGTGAPAVADPNGTDTNGRIPTEEAPALQEVAPDQAEQALSDAMLVSAVSLLLAFGAEEGESSASSEDVRLTLSWTEDADFSTGIGTYTVTMNEYSMPAENLFYSEYHGYILDGVVTLGSEDGVRQNMTFDLRASHSDAENYPVQTIDIEISGAAAGTNETASGHVVINGHKMDLRDLSAAFELSG